MFVCNIYADVNRLPSFLMSPSLDRNKEPVQKGDCRLLPFAKRNVSRRQSTKIQRCTRRLHLGRERTLQRRSKNIIILRTDCSSTCGLLILPRSNLRDLPTRIRGTYIHFLVCLHDFAPHALTMTKTASGIHTPSFPLSLSLSLSSSRFLHAHHRCSRIAETEWTSAQCVSGRLPERTEPGTLRCAQQANGCRDRANPRRGCNASRVGCKTRPTAWKDDGARDKMRRDASLFTVYAGLHMQSETVRWFRTRRFKSADLRRKCTEIGMKCIIWHVSSGIKACVFAELSVLNAAVDDEHVKPALNKVLTLRDSFSKSSTYTCLFWSHRCSKEWIIIWAILRILL